MKPFNDTYVMYQLLEFINESTIITLCKVSKKLNEICKQYIEMEDDKRFEVIVNDSELLHELCMNNDIIKIKKMNNIDIDWDWALLAASKSGNLDIVNLVIKKGANYWHYGLEGACSNGHLDILKLMIEKGANHWNCGLAYACKNDHIDIVKFLIEKGANNWERGLELACRYSHVNIVKLMIKKGATECCYCYKSMEWHLKSE